ncbi:hypothetical protein ANO14919_049640 [Xylariales sp. No.14919]|nr:hypothetical protein ANO14919_049640 [Xylariales sp. No.14919]
MTATSTPPLAALTTVFTPPCPITWLLTSTKVPSQYPSFATTAPASCDPPLWDEYVAERGFEYYSPAICPSGFYVGPSCIVTNPRTAQGFPAIEGGETAAYCIPNGHTCTSDTSDFRGGVWGVSRTDSAKSAQVTVGPAIQIRWRDEDLDNLETDPLTPGPRTTIVAQPSPDPDPTVIETSFIFSTLDPTTTSTSTSTPRSSSPTPPSTKLITISTTTSGVKTIPEVQSISSASGSTSTSTVSSLSPLSPISPFVSLPIPSRQPQGSQSSTAPTTAVSQDGQLGNDRDRSREGGNSSSNFTVAATVLTTILITIIVTYAGYSTMRQYRRYRAGQTTTFFVFQMHAWVRRQLRLKQRADDTAVEEEKELDRRKIPDAELGTEGPLTELGSAQPFGTKENPAELPTMGRWSWKSRVSRMLTVRTRQGSLASEP